MKKIKNPKNIYYAEKNQIFSTDYKFILNGKKEELVTVIKTKQSNGVELEFEIDKNNCLIIM